MPDRRSMLIVRNPRARTAPSELELIEASAAIAPDGWDVEARTTDAPGHAETLAREAAAAGTDVVVACGGDGTVREVTSGLVGSETALGVIPGGTANVWAREAGIPRGVKAALGSIARASRHRVDTGIARLDGGPAERFLLMCSAGLDARVLHAVEGSQRKARWGRAAFAWPALQSLRSASPVEASITVDGGAAARRSLMLLLAGNSRLYGGVLRLTPEALIDDGLLDMCTFSTEPGGRGRASLVGRALWRGLKARGGEARGIETARGASITVEAEAPLPVQADGEYLGTAEHLDIRVAPSSLLVLLGEQGRELLGG